MLTLERGERPAPKHVAIVALGASNYDYIKGVTQIVNFENTPDECWGINHAILAFRCDLGFLLDGFDSIGWGRHSEYPDMVGPTKELLDKRPEGAVMFEERMKRFTDHPIFVPYPAPEYPSARVYPIGEIVRRFEDSYFSSTVSYAIAYAIFIGVRRIDLFGMDFAYSRPYRQLADGSWTNVIVGQEPNRAGVEYWCGRARGAGIDVRVTDSSQLLNANNRFYYGYWKKQPPIHYPPWTNEPVMERKVSRDDDNSDVRGTGAGDDPVPVNGDGE